MAASVTPPVGRPSGGPISPEQKMKDLQLNLRDFEEGCKSGKLTGKEIKELSAVLGNDIVELRRLFPRDARIEALDTRLAIAASMDAGPATPAVGNQTTLVNRARAQISDDVRRGIATLNTTYGTMPIKPDGHCLFRSVAVGLVGEIVHSTEAQRKAYMDNLQTKVPQDAQNQALFRDFCTVVTRACAENNTAVFNDPNWADIPVAFLRMLACEHMRANPDAFSGFIEGSPSVYLARMKDMQQFAWGGETEIKALSNALGIGIEIVNLQQVGRGIADHLRHGAQGAITISVIYDGTTHYDLGFKLPQSEGQPPDLSAQRREGEVRRQAAGQQPPRPQPAAEPASARAAQSSNQQRAERQADFQLRSRQNQERRHREELAGAGPGELPAIQKRHATEKADLLDLQRRNRQEAHEAAASLPPESLVEKNPDFHAEELD